MQSTGLVFKKEEMIIVSLKQALGGITLTGYRILPFLDFREEEKEGAILHNLERFFEMYKESKDNFFIGLPRDTALLRFLKLPIAVEENLKATLGYEMDRHTPFSFDDVYFDCHVVKRSPESSLLYVMLITIKKDLIDYYLNLLKKINLRPRGIELTTTALCNVFQQANAPSEKLFDIPWLKKNTIFKERHLKLFLKASPKLSALLKEPEEKQLPPAIEVLVEYLHNGCYELNVTSNCMLYYSRIVQSQDKPLDVHFHELYNNGQNAIIHLPYEKDKESTPHFVLSGKEMEKEYLEYIPEEISSYFSVVRDFPVRIDMNSQKITPPVLPLLSVPIGLALKGLKKAPLDINLIPSQFRLKKKRSKKKILAAAVVVLFFFIGGAYFISNIIKMNTQLVILDEQLSELKLQVQTIEDLQKETDKIEQFSGVIKNIRKNDISKIDILEELTQIMPLDSWLTDLTYTEEGRKVKISGYAISASKLIPILEESKLFENVKFTSPITIDKKEKKERFRIEMIVSRGNSKA